MIRTRSDLKYYLAEDRKRTPMSRTYYYMGIFLGVGGGKTLQLLKRLRHYEYAYNNRDKNIWFKLLYLYQKLRYFRLQAKLDTYIWPNSVGPGLQIPHLGGIIINCKSMGRNCSVNKGVVIGNKKGQENRAIIGDNCWFTLGCKVIGKVNIGDNVIVCQNSVVVKDVDNNCIVSGVPAKVIRRYDNIDEVSI